MCRGCSLEGDEICEAIVVISRKERVGVDSSNLSFSSKTFGLD